MKYRVLVAASALGLVACASAPPGMSFSERQEAAIAAKVAEACTGKADKAYANCAAGVRTDVVARERSSFPPQNRSNENSQPTSREVASN